MYNISGNGDRYVKHKGLIFLKCMGGGEWGWGKGINVF